MNYDHFKTIDFDYMACLMQANLYLDILYVDNQSIVLIMYYILKIDTFNCSVM